MLDQIGLAASKPWRGGNSTSPLSKTFYTLSSDLILVYVRTLCSLLSSFAFPSSVSYDSRCDQRHGGLIVRLTLTGHLRPTSASLSRLIVASQ